MGRRLVGGIYIVQAALGGSPRSGPNFQLFLSGQLRPMLRLPKEEFAVLFIICVSRVPLALPRVLSILQWWVTLRTSNYDPALSPYLLDNLDGLPLLALSGMQFRELDGPPSSTCHSSHARQ